MMVGAQARDLQPDHVRICPLYGEGFYYIPGTDTCVWFGGKVRADYGWNVTGVNFPVYFGSGHTNPAIAGIQHRPSGRFRLRRPHADGLRHVANSEYPRALRTPLVQTSSLRRALSYNRGLDLRACAIVERRAAFGEDGARIIHTIPNDREPGKTETMRSRIHGRSGTGWRCMSVPVSGASSR